MVLNIKRYAKSILFAPNFIILSYMVFELRSLKQFIFNFKFGCKLQIQRMYTSELDSLASLARDNLVAPIRPLFCTQVFSGSTLVHFFFVLRVEILQE